MRRIFVIFLVLAASCSLGANEFVTLSNLAGKKIECQIVNFRDGEVWLKFRDGRSFKFPLDDLDPTSQEIVKDRIIRGYSASMDVRSIMNSSRESKDYGMYGGEHRMGTKERKFSVKVKTFSPFTMEVMADCFFFKGDRWRRKKIQGEVSNNSFWEFEVGDSTSWRAFSYNSATLGGSNDYMSGSDRIDLVIFLRNADGDIIDQYATSRFAEEAIEENVIAREE